MTIGAFIFARGGSKGLPGKNILNMCGKPLLAHAISVAKDVGRIQHCFVSSDDDEILEIAKKYGAIAIKRPDELATDNASEWLAWRHAIDVAESHISQKIDVFVSLPPTAPLRISDDVEKCIDAFNEGADIVVTMTQSQRSPWFNMVCMKDNGEEIQLLTDGDKTVTRRQDAPTTFDMTTVAYVSSPEYIRNCKMWDGRVKGVIIPQQRAVDIDTAVDFKLAEILMHERNNGDSIET